MSDNGIYGHETPNTPKYLKLRSSTTFILLTVCVAIFTDAFIYGVVVPVIPFSLKDRSGVSEDDVQWWTSVLLAAFGCAILVGSPFCGWYADRYLNRQIPFFVGLIVLTFATALFGVAQSAAVLLISRIIQGLSSAIVYTIGLAVLVDTVGREEIGQWMGTALSSSSVGLIISPMLGGFVYFHAGYTAVLSMAVGLICVDIILRMLMIERKSARKYNQKSSSAQYGTFESTQRENSHDSENVESSRTSDPSSPTQMESSTSTLSPLRATLQDSESRFPPLLTLLGSYRVLAAIYGVFVNVSVLASFDSVLPIFVKRTFNWTSLESGLIFLTVAVPALAGPLVGQLSDRFGPRPIAVFGCAGTAPFLVLLQLVSHDSEEQVVLLCGLLTLIGCTLIFIISPLAADLSFVVEQMERDDPGAFGEGGAYGQAYALFNCSMAAATMFGPIFAGSLVENYGWKTMAWGMGAFSFSGAIPCWLYTGGPLTNSEEAHSARNEEGDVFV